MTPAQREALATLAPRYRIEFAAQPIDLRQLFGRDAPLMVEIGFGNGDSLVALGEQMPDHNIIGIEVHEPGIGHCMLVADKAGLTNLKIICHDAIEVLREQLPERCVTRLNLYFPDPWPKKRHHKRRILAEKFLDLVDKVLSDDGALHIATDWANYAEQIDETMANDSRFVCAERVEHDGDKPLQRPATKFERRGLRLGHRIVDWRFKRSTRRELPAGGTR